MINVSHISYAYQKKKTLLDISFKIAPGEICALMGLNGSGKTTLLKLIAKLLPVQEGRIEINGKSIADYSQRELAQEIAYVPQRQDIVFDFSVYDTVMMGRNPYQNRWESYSKKDDEIVREVLDQCHLTHLQDRMLTNLSGGEMQRTLIARAMAQQAPLMLLDEPLANLDIIHKYEIMDILYQLNQKHGTTTVIILHEITFAKQYAEQILFLKDGKLRDDGKSAQVLHADNIRNAFGLSEDYEVDEFGNVFKKKR